MQTNNAENNGAQSTEVMGIMEEVIERVRLILDRFEQVVQEAYNVIEMIRDLYYEIRELFSLRSSAAVEEEELLEYA